MAELWLILRRLRARVWVIQLLCIRQPGGKLHKNAGSAERPLSALYGLALDVV